MVMPLLYLSHIFPFSLLLFLALPWLSQPVVMTPTCSDPEAFLPPCTWFNPPPSIPVWMLLNPLLSPSSLLRIFNFHALPGKASLWNCPCWSPGWKTVFSPVLTYCGLYYFVIHCMPPSLFSALWMGSCLCFAASKASAREQMAILGRALVTCGLKPAI